MAHLLHFQTPLWTNLHRGLVVVAGAGAWADVIAVELFLFRGIVVVLLSLLFVRPLSVVGSVLWK